MQDKHQKIRNLGVLTDAAYANFRVTLSYQAVFTAATSAIFIVTTILLSYLCLGLIWPAIPNFTGVAVLTDGIVLGIFFIIIIMLCAFFIIWQNTMVIVVLQHPGSSLAALARPMCRAARVALGLLLAYIAALLPIFIIFTIVMFANIANIFTMLPIMLLILLIVIILVRALFFFAGVICISDEARAFSAVVRSAILVIKQGFARIFMLTAFITAFNAAIFVAIFMLLASVFGRIPTNLIELAETLANPLWVAVALLLAYIPSAFVSPKLSILAHSLFRPVKTPSVPASLPARTLACAMDVVFAGSAFLLVFYTASLLFGNTQPLQMSVGAVVTTTIAFFAVFTVYNIYFEVFEHGQTLGKRMLHLVVLNDHGLPPSLVQSLVRNVLRIVDIFGFVAMIFTKDRHRLGDMLSLTTVEYFQEVDTDVL